MAHKIKTKLEIIRGRPDLTPMIDVVFLLLIFFMLSSSFVRVSGVKVELPVTESDSKSSAEKLVITIDHKNQFYFNDRPLSWGALKAQVNSFKTKWKADTAIVRADRGTSYGEVTRLVAFMKESGLNVYLATMPMKQEEIRLQDESSY